MGILDKKRIILVGPAGSGKDYFKDYLSNNTQYPVDVSYTTRPMRDGEIADYTYKFISDDEFNLKKSCGDFYESVKFNGWQYGTSLDCWNRGGFFIMTPSGIANIKDSDVEDTGIVYFNIDEQVRRERIALRSDSDSVERRITADKLDFKNIQDVMSKFPLNIYVNNPLYEPDQLLNSLLKE